MLKFIVRLEDVTGPGTGNSNTSHVKVYLCVVLNFFPLYRIQIHLMLKFIDDYLPFGQVHKLDSNTSHVKVYHYVDSGF